VSAERKIEAALLGARWLLLPLYVVLLVGMLFVYVMAARETFQVLHEAVFGSVPTSS
jgi:uncharacterized membrane protein YqhA